MHSTIFCYRKEHLTFALISFVNYARFISQEYFFQCTLRLDSLDILSVYWRKFAVVFGNKKNRFKRITLGFRSFECDYSMVTHTTLPAVMYAVNNVIMQFGYDGVMHKLLNVQFTLSQRIQGCSQKNGIRLMR